jgi:hypothetical protein
VVRKIVFGLLACSLVAGQASAQNWSFDARKIGLGSPGGDENLATQMIDEARNYGSVVLPFGLFQVMNDFDKLKPTNDQFDLIRTMEYAASPLHYTFGRNTTDSGSRFVEDIRNATLNRDLNYYRGFVPANQPPAEGLAAPNWGRTIKVAKGPGGAFSGVVRWRRTVSLDAERIRHRPSADHNPGLAVGSVSAQYPDAADQREPGTDGHGGLPVG